MPLVKTLSKPEEAMRKLETFNDSFFAGETDNPTRQTLAEVDTVTLADTLYPILSQLRAIIYGNNPGSWTDVPVSSLKDLLDLVSALGSGDGLTMWTAEEDINLGEVVYASADGSIKKAHANDISTKNIIGVAYENILMGTAGCVAHPGREQTGYVGLIPTEKYFLGNGGAIVTTPATGSGTFKMAVGIAKNPTTLLIQFGDPRVTP